MLKENSVLLYENDQYTHLIVSPMVSCLTYVITFDSITGTPLYSGIPETEIFTEQEKAIDYVTKNFCSHEVQKAYAVIGLSFSKIEQSQFPIASLILATKIKETAIIAKNTHIYTIMRSIIFNINHKDSSAPINLFPLSKHHYFTTNKTITTSFYNNMTNDSFIWNSTLKIPFLKMGVDFICPDILQGCAMSSVFGNILITFLSRTALPEVGKTSSFQRETEYEIIVENNDEVYDHTWLSGTPITSKDDQLNYLTNFHKKYELSIFNSISINQEGSDPEENFNHMIQMDKQNGPMDKNTESKIYRIKIEDQTIEMTTNHYSFPAVQDLVQEQCFKTMSSTLLPSIYFIYSKSRFQKIINRFTSSNPSYAILWYSRLVISALMSQFSISFKNPFFISNVTTLSSAITSDIWNVPYLHDKNEESIPNRWNKSSFGEHFRENIDLIFSPSNVLLCKWIMTLPSVHFGHIPLPGLSRVEIPHEVFTSPIPIFAVLNCERGVSTRLIFPRPFKMTQLLLNLNSTINSKYAPKSIIIMGGMTLNSMELITSITLPTTNQDTLTFSTLSNFIRIIELKFFGEGSKMVLGKIEIKGKIAMKKSAVKYIDSPPLDECSFQKAFEEYMKSPKKPIDALNLEISRISNRIDSERAHILEASSGMNPYSCSIEQIIPQLFKNEKTKNPTNCALCNKADASIVYCNQSHKYPNILILSNLKKKKPNDLEQSHLHLCPDCLKKVEESNNLIFQLPQKQVLFEYPSFNPISPEKFSPFIFSEKNELVEQCIGFGSTSVISNFDCPELFTSTGGNREFNNATLKFVFTHNNVILKRITIVHFGHMLLNFPDFSSYTIMTTQKKGDKKKTTILFSDSSILSSFEMDISAKVKRFMFWGLNSQSNWPQFIPASEEILAQTTFVPIRKTIPIKKENWDMKSRSVIVVLPSMKCQAIMITTQNIMKRKLWFSFCKDNRFLVWKEINLPFSNDIESDKKLMYINEFNGDVDNIIIYDNDSNVKFEPLEIELKVN